MPNQLVHFEIGCRDREASGKFYSGLFDWKLEEHGDMTMLRTGSDVGGHLGNLGHEPYNYTIMYFHVDDIHASAERVTELGGKVIVGPVEYSPGNTFAWVADPEGNMIGLHHEAKK